MKDIVKLYSADKKSSVTIDKGELVSYLVNDIEIMHQKEDAGWGSTEIEMFPIIGATKGNNFSVVTPRGDSKLDQHGILRTLDYSTEKTDSTTASFYKKYSANTLVSNPKFPHKSSLKKLNWPYDFKFLKTFAITNEGLKILFEITSEVNMPFMLGFHPAFKVYNHDFVIRTEDKSISLDNILEVGAKAFLLEKCKDLTLENNGNLGVRLRTSGYRHIMLWSEVKNMVCIEPITFYPPSVTTGDLHTGFDHSSGYEKFEVVISPSVS
ncbi:aldose epimerase family protein [Aquimarina sediminis]|uniref:aldose epimerase family protein n=1 Tax=Aquimarina sediminis TaxID=2070536 RepID=UPI000CA01DD6|nr:aldose epimerase [Aquimarina sediminis]